MSVDLQLEVLWYGPLVRTGQLPTADHCQTADGLFESDIKDNKYDSMSINIG